MDALIAQNDKWLSVIVFKYLYTRCDSAYELKKIAESLEKLENRELTISAWKKVVEHSMVNGVLEVSKVKAAAEGFKRLEEREAAIDAEKKCSDIDPLRNAKAAADS